MTPVLEADRLTKTFRLGARQWPAVSDVSLQLDLGRTVGCVGESGSGKSTLARLLVGAETPSEGVVRFEGIDLQAFDRTRRRSYARDVQLVFQSASSALPPRMRIAAIIEDPLIVHRLGSSAERRARVREIASLVGLDLEMLDRLPRQLSGGQRQRVGIARALALEPAVVLADEPVASLDASVQSQILNLFVRLQEQLKFALFVISHDLRVINYLADEVVVLYLGQVMEIGTAARVVTKPLHPYTRALVDAIPGRGGVQSVVRSAPGEATAANVLLGCPFAPRCSVRARLGREDQDLCTSTRPPLRTLQGRRVACHWAAV